MLIPSSVSAQPVKKPRCVLLKSSPGHPRSPGRLASPPGSASPDATRVKQEAGTDAAVLALVPFCDAPENGSTLVPASPGTCSLDDLDPETENRGDVGTESSDGKVRGCVASCH